MISLVTNIDSLMAQQNLQVNSQVQSNAINQLTSGYRINSSADDAAGLSVANGYRNQIAELNQGVLNANQGVSQLQIVDGGLSNVSQMLDRLKTLATESASQTFTGNRNTLQNEYSSLLTEINRQADNVGLGDNNKANASNIKVYIGGGQSSDANSSVSVNLSSQSVSSTGLGLAGTSVLTTAPVSSGSTAAASVIAAGHTDTFSVNTASGTLAFTITGQTGDTVQGQVNEVNAQLQAVGITASLNTAGKLQFQSGSAFSIDANAGTAADLVDHSSHDKVLNTGLNNAQYTGAAAGDVVAITVGSSTATLTTVGTGQAAVTQINQALQTAGITSVTAVLDATGATGTISLQGSGTFTTTITPTGSGAIASATTAAAGGDPNAAINAVTQAVQSLGSIQGVVGAGMNTLNYAINLAQSQITSFSSAQSQIRDANVAAEAAALTKSQALQQSSIAAMAQANAEPQAVLALLKNL